MDYSGQIVRIVPSLGLVYVADSMGAIFSFRLGAVDEYKGEPLSDLGFEIGSALNFRVGDNRQVLQVTRLGKTKKKKMSVGGSH